MEWRFVFVVLKLRKIFYSAATFLLKKSLNFFFVRYPPDQPRIVSVALIY
jgi:hypothetical protein